MKSVVALVVACLIASSMGAEMLHRESMIEFINNDPTSTWRAGVNARFVNYTVDEFRGLLGTYLRPHVPSPSPLNIAGVPEEFDSRTKWPHCIGAIRDQGKCGSCWAFGATEAFSDRVCIQTGEQVDLAAQDITSCDHNDHGCNGGWLETAWEYLVSKGIVTEACWPYELPPCVHPCGTPLPTPSCKSACKDPSRSFAKDKHFATKARGIPSGEIQNEIMTNGPVEAAFTVYDDFPTYKSGVYQHKSSKVLGGHAIKIIGWGLENGVPYWQVANSWNTNWGNQGFFRILRGKDECGIEGDVVAGMAVKHS